MPAHPRDPVATASRVLPWALPALLALRYAPALAASDLLQGDLPGHLETIRWYALHVWPLPWGWDPRFLMGAPVGILYPPLFHWIGGGLGKLVGPEAAMKVLLLASVVALPHALAAAARGLGLRRREAGYAAAAGLCVLWLPGPGLGGTLRQTLVAGNAANAFALPLLLMLVATLRRGLGRPGKWPLPAALLAACLLSHFLVGAVAGLSVVAFAASSVRKMRRGLLIAGLGLLTAAPFLVPFVVHFREGSPDAIAFSPSPGRAEWIALALLAALAWAAGRRARRILAPALVLIAILYLLRGVLFPLLGEPPFRMEWHRFRLFLYLALVPAATFAVRRTHRLVLALPALCAVALIVLWPYDARGPRPLPVPQNLPDLTGERVLVLASPGAQNGSWHGLQTRLPDALHALGTKGLFVEASPFARGIFEVERAMSGIGAKPRWWGITIVPVDPPEGAAETWLDAYGIGVIAAVDPVSPALDGLDEPFGASAGKLRLLRVRSALPLRAAGLLPYRGRDVVDASGSDDGGSATFDFAATGGEARLMIAAFSDWGVRSGDGTLVASPLREGLPPGTDLGPALDACVLAVRGRGKLEVAVRPRSEEWLGLALGLLGAIGIAAGRLRARA